MTIGGVVQTVTEFDSTAQEIDDAVQAVKTVVPSGVIVMWSGVVADVPAGWLLCDGTNGTPDLRGRFIVGAGGEYTPGSKGGAAEVTLSKDQLPAHAHTFLGEAHTHQGTINMSSLECSEAGEHQHKIDVYATRSTGKLTRYSWQTGRFQDTSSSDDHLALDFSATSPKSSDYYYTNSDTTEGTHTHTVSGNGTVEIAEATVGGTVGSAGSGQAHENRPPYYALCYIMKQ